MIVKDLRVGKDGETRVQTLLTSFGFVTSFVDKENRKFYDLKCDNPLFTVEIKNDLYSARSGNVAIEIFNPKSNTSSGLTATLADIWAHIICSKIYFTKTNDLRKFINEVTPTKIISAGGDKNANLMLYNIDLILPIFTAEEHLTKDLILGMINGTS